MDHNLERRHRHLLKLSSEGRPDDVNRKMDRLWRAAFPERAHDRLARWLGVAAGGVVAWWAYGTYPNTQWWLIGLVFLVTAFTVGAVLVKNRRLTNVVAGAVVIVGAVLLIIVIDSL